MITALPSGRATLRVDVTADPTCLNGLVCTPEASTLGFTGRIPLVDTPHTLSYVPYFVP